MREFEDFMSYLLDCKDLESDITGAILWYINKYPKFGAHVMESEPLKTDFCCLLDELNVDYDADTKDWYFAKVLILRFKNKKTEYNKTVTLYSILSGDPPHTNYAPPFKDEADVDRVLSLSPIVKSWEGITLNDWGYDTMVIYWNGFPYAVS